jgi:hypothetical protein
MATSAETFAAVANTTVALPMLQEVVRTLLPISLNEGTIVLCGNNEISISTACVCSKTYTRSAGRCVECAPGTSKATDADAACGECSGNTFSGTGAAQCSACPLSATTRQNHTTCACKTGFVFFKDVCTQTKNVYMNVSGILQMPYGDFSASQLQAILLESMSTYLNFSREFITVIVTPPIEIINSTVTNTTATEGVNTTDANETNDTMPGDGSQSGRRLLFELPVDYYFIALFQIEIGDEEAYAKIQNFTSEIKNERRSITNANGYRILMKDADLTSGYINENGDKIDACPDGRPKVPDETKKELVCEQQEPEPSPQPAPQQDYTQLMIGLLVATLIALIVGVFFYREAGHYTRRTTRTHEEQELLPHAATFPARQQCPATVSFEYQLLSGQSI